VALLAFNNDEYPENPENTSQVFGTYPHGQLIIKQLDGTRYRFLLKPATPQTAAIELTDADVDLAHFVAAVPVWVKVDPDLTKISLIDREWNRQQIRLARSSLHVHAGGDGFEQRALSRVDLARNCLNAGLWELLLFTTEDGEERVYEHVWFTFPLGLYKQLFEQVNGLSYWSYWWRLEHWVDPSGTPLLLDRLRTVERERTVSVSAQWDEPPAVRGEQLPKQRNILTPPAPTYRDWHNQPVHFSSFIQPGRYSRAHPRETQLHYLAELTGSVIRRIKTTGDPRPLFEIELTFRSSKTGEPARLILGGLDLAAVPAGSPKEYERGWQVPFGIGKPSYPTHVLRVSSRCSESLARSPCDRCGWAAAPLGCRQPLGASPLPAQL
jgi:hypothetical protein